MPSAIRSLLPLVIGLAVGGMAVTWYGRSLPGEPGSAEERAKRFERDLKHARAEIAALKATDPERARRPGRSMRDGLRDIADDIRAGRPVTPDDLFRMTQPLLRDLAPLLDRIRVRDQQRQVESMTGELARKYDLTAPQQAALAKWFEAKARENATRWTDLVTRDGTKLEDLVRATRDLRADDGLDEFMDRTLSGDKLAAFKTERMAQRAERVQQSADRAVARLDGLVGLDDAQRDQVFGIAARSAPDYDPGMKLEGLGGEIAGQPAGNPRDAMLGVLRPDQLEAYEAARQQRHAEASQDAAALGLTLPPDWSPLDELE
jgi:hypothetical protein